MPNLIPFQFENSNIRVVVIDDAPWFSARDVALALGYENPSKAYNDHCKHLKKLSYNESLELGWQKPNPQGEYVMPEGDVYRLAAKSQLESAERFELWVYDEVLPSIRKTGSYFSSGNDLSLIQPAEEFKAVYSVAQILFEGNQAVLSANVATRKLTGIDMLDYLGATHLTADSQDILLTVTELGQRIGLSRSKVNPLLADMGLIKGYRDHRNRRQWELTPAGEQFGVYQDTGKKHSDGTPVRQIKWYSKIEQLLENHTN